MAENCQDSWAATLPQNDKVRLHEPNDCVIAGPYLDRLVKHKNECKQVPVDDSCVNSESYYRDSIYEFGPGIVLDP